MSGASTPRGNASIATLQSIRSLQRQTTALTLENGRLRSSLANTISECNSLQANNTTLVAANASLRQQIGKLKQLDEVGRRFSILSHHLESLMQSVDLLTPR
jgi:cell division protein FtsB